MGNTRIRLTPGSNRCKKLTVLQLDAVDRDIHRRDINFFVATGYKVVIAGDISPMVPDVTKKGAQWTVIVKRQGKRTKRAVGSLQLDRHVHRDPKAGRNRPLQGVGLDDRAACLIREQIHRVRGMVPEQMVGPAAGVAKRVHIGATEEEGLHVQMLERELARNNSPMDPLVARIESAGMPNHGDETCALLQREYGTGVCQLIGERNLDLYMFACPQALHCLRSMHLGRRTQNDRIEARQREALGKLGRAMPDPEALCHQPRWLELATDERHHLDPIDLLNRLEVLDPECPGTCQRNFQWFRLHGFNSGCPRLRAGSSGQYRRIGLSTSNCCCLRGVVAIQGMKSTSSPSSGIWSFRLG